MFAVIYILFPFSVSKIEAGREATCSIFFVAAPSAVAAVERQAAVLHVQRQVLVVVSCDNIRR